MSQKSRNTKALKGRILLRITSARPICGVSGVLLGHNRQQDSSTEDATIYSAKLAESRHSRENVSMLRRPTLLGNHP